jgi:hypothetical protein
MTADKRRGDGFSMFREMANSHSIGLTGGQFVSLLSAYLGYREVRVMTDVNGGAMLDEDGTWSDPRLGRVCWVAAEALGPSSH